MRIVIIGAVAAGTSAAAEIRRRNKEAQIVIYEKDNYISYSGCGMPYYISNEFSDFNELVPRNPRFFKEKYDADILIGHEVLSIQPDKNALTIKNIVTGEIFQDTYDYMIISTGASSEKPPIKGSDKENVFLLRTIEHMNAIKSYIEHNKPKTAAIIGTGLVGLEMCESFTRLGIETTLIARSSIAKSMDNDMTIYIENNLKKNGVKVLTNTPTKEINDSGVVLNDGSIIDADIVLLATGVHPNVELAEKAGIEIGATGSIKVDRKMKTNIDNIYSCGDCSEQFNIITGKPVYRPMGSTANKTGIIAGNNITGGNDEFRGILETLIFRVFDMTAAQTGLTEKEAKRMGYDVVVSTDSKSDKPEYMGGKKMVIKTIAEKNSGRLLGAQIIGYEGVDKRIDVFVTAITLKATAEDLIYLDLAYAPPYSIPKDPLFFTGIKLRKALK
ncbi:MAG: FAD-dependent oxidoreductase [Sedimentibacter sp.]|uniref:FAD-dependent oxidoreductase n=1 Tax=Sedimentibacter sp. TaxID=1960295 RepID=UPI00298246B3|nr:FAD-dependent oxidoreductase [Sedimentibacter sp.]MDW5299707.1 FAD-dependent oxidoreductase [Sedimentibacter sp.]